MSTNMTSARSSMANPTGTFNIMGSYEIGANVALVLLGVLLVQAYFYYEHYPNDRVAFKALVAIMM